MNLMSQSAFRIRESNCPHSLIKLSTRNIWIMFTPPTIHYPYMNNAMIISIIWNTSTVPCYIGEYCKWFCDNLTSIKPWVLDPKNYSINDDMAHTLHVVLWRHVVYEPDCLRKQHNYVRTLRKRIVIMYTRHVFLVLQS